METTRNFVIVAGFVGLVFIGFTLKSWVMAGRREPFKTEIKYSAIFFIAAAIIAVTLIYINNRC